MNGTVDATVRRSNNQSPANWAAGMDEAEMCALVRKNCLVYMRLVVRSYCSIPSASKHCRCQASCQRSPYQLPGHEGTSPDYTGTDSTKSKPNPNPNPQPSALMADQLWSCS